MDKILQHHQVKDRQTVKGHSRLLQLFLFLHPIIVIINKKMGNSISNKNVESEPKKNENNKNNPVIAFLHHGKC
ncbi:CLUMA_CG012738, isoform A [Clunio marinus]|uniref:CLUMA_CG012738, isoform A n=1 Tax=Clunio marinus TaxID=568069 RepID=A0A1J1IGP5_9DIPT|nr:CLUMA_CG012738, isoform A [Clunio marinus]